MTMKKEKLKYLIYALIVLLVIFLLSQLQPWVIERAGGVDGSFGVRPVTHKCLGFTYSANGSGIFPSGEVEFRLIRFYFRYSVSDDDDRPLCAGQDVWYGE